MNFALLREIWPPVRHPFVDLLTYRSNLQSDSKDSLDPRESRILDSLPFLDKGRIHRLSRLKTTEEMLASYSSTPIYSPDDISTLLEIYAERRPPSIITMIVCFHGIDWAFRRRPSLLESDYVLLVRALGRLFDTSFAKVISYTTESVFDTALSSSIFPWSADSLQASLVHIQVNKGLDSAFFPRLLSLMKRIAIFGAPEFIDDMLVLADGLIVSESPILDVEDKSLLLVVFQPFLQSLHPIALRALARFSKIENDRALRDSYRMVASSFAAAVVENELPGGAADSPIPELGIEFPLIFPMPPFPSEICPEFESVYDFDELPYDQVLSVDSVETLLHERSRRVVQSVSNCLFESCQPCRRDFVETFIVIASAFANSPAYLYLSAAFLSAVAPSCNDGLLETLMPFVFLSPVFHSRSHIFDSQALDRLVNSLRALMFAVVIRQSKEFFFSALQMLTVAPILFAESLVRFLAFPLVFPPNLFANGIFLKQLFAVSVCLQTVNRRTADPLVFKARTVLFTFTAMLLRDSQTAPLCLSSPVFVSGFFRFVYEKPLCETILILLRNALVSLPIGTDLSNLVEFLGRICNSCTAHANDPDYELLATRLASTVVDVVAHSPALSSAFHRFVLPMVRVLDRFPRPPLLDMLFALLAYITAGTRAGDVPVEKVLSVIRKVDREYPSRKAECSLLGLLSGCATASVGAPFLIKVPSAIPLILAVFGRSPRLEDIVRFFFILCKFSDHNRRMCNDGDLDLILLQFALADQEAALINYHGESFPFQLPMAEFISLFWPIFADISMLKSSSAISHVILKHLISKADFSFAKALDLILFNSQALPLRVFTLGSLPTAFEVKGLFGPDLNTGFTVHFKAQLDVKLLCAADVRCRIFVIRDSDENELTVFLAKKTLTAKYQANGRRTTVPVVLAFPASVWVHVKLLFDLKDSRAEISTFLDGHRLNDSEFCFLHFGTGPISIFVGGVEECCAFPEPWQNRQFGVLSGFRIFPFLDRGDRNGHRDSRLRPNYEASLQCRLSFPSPGVHSTNRVFRPGRHFRDYRHCESFAAGAASADRCLLHKR
jgi:hypothetical protein